MNYYTFIVIAFAIPLSGCVNRINSMTAPTYQAKTTPVSALGITGGGAAVAIPAFVRAGYKVVDTPSSSSDPLSVAKSKNLPFLANIDAVGTEGSWWDGFFDYSMRVTEVENGTIVWSSTAEYGQGGMFINQVKSSDSAMRDMVSRFSKSFPPK